VFVVLWLCSMLHQISGDKRDIQTQQREEQTDGKASSENSQAMVQAAIHTEPTSKQVNVNMVIQTNMTDKIPGGKLYK